MKKQHILFILLLVLPIFIYAKTEYSFKVAAFNPKASEEKLRDPYNYFYKVDENKNILDNAEFIIRDANGKLKYDVTYDNDSKSYKYLNTVEEDYDKIINLLPQTQKDIILGFKKYSDILPYSPIMDESHDTYEFLKNNNYIESFCYNNSISDIVDDVRYNSCFINTIFPLFLEEIKTPKGYEKEMSFINSMINIIFEFDQDTGYISSIKPSIKLYLPIKYDDKIDYSNYDELYNLFSNIDESNIDESNKYVYDRITCNLAEEKEEDVSSTNFSKYKVSYLKDTANNYRINKISTINLDDESFSAKCFAPIIVDKKGSSALTVNSYVNSKEEINLTESSNVEIKVFLKNSGKAPSYENKVVSNVPEGVEYVAGSATDNGVYDEEKNTVTWDLDYLDASSGYIFSYEVAVTTGSKESVYVTTSSVSSEENETPIVSNEAKVTTPGVGGDAPEEENEEIINPKTGVSYPIMLMLVLLLGSALTLIFTSKKKIDLN